MTARTDLIGATLTRTLDLEAGAARIAAEAVDDALNPTPAPARVDTFRNRLTATRDLLAIVEAEADDLYALAYDRPQARGEHVRGGSRDYALDTHGDLTARRALRNLHGAALGAAATLAEAAHDTVAALRAGSSPQPRIRAAVTAAELVDAIDAQARRAERGEYTPVAHHRPPPALKPALDELRRQHRDELAERDQTITDLRAERDRLRSRLDLIERSA